MSLSHDQIVFDLTELQYYFSRWTIFFNFIFIVTPTTVRSTLKCSMRVVRTTYRIFSHDLQISFLGQSVWLRQYLLGSWGALLLVQNGYHFEQAHIWKLDNWTFEIRIFPVQGGCADSLFVSPDKSHTLSLPSPLYTLKLFTRQSPLRFLFKYDNKTDFKNVRT